MTDRKAVVPIDDDTSVIYVMSKDEGKEQPYLVKQCKLTKTDIEQMARKAYNSAETRKSEHRGSPTFFDDLLFFQRQNLIRDMAAAAKSIGFEVEE